MQDCKIAFTRPTIPGSHRSRRKVLSFGSTTTIVSDAVNFMDGMSSLGLIFAPNFRSRTVSICTNQMDNGINQRNAKLGGIRIESNPKVNKLQQLLDSHPDGWDECWKLGVTPWDLGRATPIVLHLLQTGALPNGRALVPGCGSGYDVVAMACPERYVVGLDISENAIKKAVEMSSSSPNAKYSSFLKEDFFTWCPSEQFDVIFDYTFFCAIIPPLRPLWGQRMRELLKEDGELITLMFPLTDHVGGPPFKVSVSDYEEVLLPLGFKAMSIVDNELAIGGRAGKGVEKLGRWKRLSGQSAM